VSDGHRELVEGCADPVAGGDVGGEFVVAAAEVLDEAMPGGQGPCGTVALHAASAGAGPSVGREATHRLAAQFRPVQGRHPDISNRFSRLPVGSRGPCVGRIVETTSDRPGLTGSSPGTVGRRNPGASGSVNRLLRPDSVRHMSVTTAMQGLTAAHHDTQRNKRKKAREPGYAQATGHFRWWWQVLGSNQRRLSRRFYRPPVLIQLYAP
jgi:hypothetical protein